MKDVLYFFEKLSAIPRCSYSANGVKEYIIEYAKEVGFESTVDKAGNVICKKGEPKVCLQSHYDMVCLGDAPKVELIRDGNILRAKNSTLGADNGMGVAIMLYCMQKYDNLECLFTANEEVGLIGATNLELEITAPNILNIDSEDENEICIGCAGGSDVVCEKEIKYTSLDKNVKTYKATVFGLPGGHSGVDIDKNITSSIKVLARFLAKYDCELIDIDAGERRNSIAKNGIALFTCSCDIKDEEHIKVEEIKNDNFKVIQNSKQIIKMLDAFAQGVRAWNKELGIPEDSTNLGIVQVKEGIFKIIISLRTMDDKKMDELEAQTKSFFDLFGFSVSFPSRHDAWTPYIGDFSKKVKEIASKYVPNIEFKAIHAGLECGVLIAKQKEPKEAVSIGPNIRFPHSIREECDLDSVEKIRKIVEDLVLLV
ncbi:MAG: M20/M25/M40 family metallo-hydrolase [Campylobacteraceae bacterium]|nr:M20/M25/M40 family metallo-hydrolase [Campylobacteraceae bacterium]